MLADRVAKLLVRLRSGDIATAEVATDTRRQHGAIFARLTPPGFDYYAGHYRGEKYPCLETYVVGVAGDPRVGSPPQSVAQDMAKFVNDVQASVNALDLAREHRLPPAEKLHFIVVVACRLLERFLAVHPYANGNGHMGRFIVWLVLGRYGYWPDDWPVEPRPPDPPYTDCIVQARNGNRAPLEDFVLNCIRGRPEPVV